MPHTPTPEQQAIISHIQQNPTRSLRVKAGAGCAKTSTLKMAAPLIKNQSVLAVAFNSRIVKDLVEDLPPFVVIKTLNALGHAAWQKARGGVRLKVDTEKLYTLTKIAVAEIGNPPSDLFTDVLALCRKAKARGLIPKNLAGPLASKTGLIPDTYDSWEDLAFESGIDLTQDAVDTARRVLARSIDLAFKGEIDFDDQIYMSVFFGGSYLRFDTVIVDESQDLSPMNHLQLEKSVGKRLIAVGDPKQAIYAFRGADSKSMESMTHTWDFDTLELTQSFRVPHAISARQAEHVPGFSSMPWLGQGEVQYWPEHFNKPEAEPERSWSIDSIPASGFILCRNNAPLMRMAFILIKARRPVKVLGRDIGASLASVIDKIGGKGGKGLDELYPALDAWKEKELLKCGESEAKRETVFDRYESLHVLIEASEGKDSRAVSSFIRDLFSDKQTSPLTLSSGHRIKGFEHDWVMHLDPHRLPSKWAQKAEQRGDYGPMEQELNLRYVIETRSKGTLVLANLEDCEELGED